MPSWRMVAAGLALAGYALASHVLMVLAGDKTWAVAALLAPLVLAVGGVAWRLRHLPTLLLCGAALGGLVWVGASGQAQSINRLYLLQHAGIHFALGCAFAYTLRPGATPLITALAARAQHGTMTHGQGPLHAARHRAMGRLLRRDGGVVANAVRLGAVVGLVDVCQSRHAGGGNRPVRR